MRIINLAGPAQLGMVDNPLAITITDGNPSDLMGDHANWKPVQELIQAAKQKKRKKVKRSKVL